VSVYLLALSRAMAVLNRAYQIAENPWLVLCHCRLGVGCSIIQETYSLTYHWLSPVHPKGHAGSSSPLKMVNGVCPWLGECHG
jgi:hypothetical protein